jgi:hypothetical protein
MVVRCDVERFRAREELGEHGGHDLGLRHQLDRHPVDEGAQLLACRPTRARQRRAELLGDAAVELVQERRLAREVEEERAAADVGLPTDVGDRHHAESRPGEEPHRGLVDLSARSLLLAVAA